MRDEGSYDPATIEDQEQVRLMAIVNCDLCDQDGYEGSRVCHHRIHSTPEVRERAKAVVAAALQRTARARTAGVEQ